MAEIIDFREFIDEPDLEGMDRQALKDLLETVRAQTARVDEQEPEDMDSEEYEAWGDLHEELEDLAEEIQDLLEEMGD